MSDRWTGRLVTVLFGDEGGVLGDHAMQTVMVLSAITVSGAFMISPVVSSLVGPFAVSGAVAGQILTAFTLPSILVVPLFGVLADRVGRKPVIVAGLVLFGSAGTAIAFVDQFQTVLLLRFVQGTGYAAVIPLTVAVVGDLYTGQREVTAQGIRIGSIQTVAILSPPLAGLLVLGSWYYPFLLFSLALPAAVWVWLWFPSLAPTETSTLGQYARDLLDSITDPFLALVLFSFLLRFALTFGFLAYISVLIDDTALVGGLAVSVLGAISLVASTQAGRVVDRLSPLLTMVAGFVLGGVGMAAIGAVTTLLSVFVGVVLFAVGTGVTGPIQKSLVSQYASRDLRAGSVSSAHIFQGMGQTGGPLLMGVAVQYTSIDAVFVAFGVGGAALGAVTMWIAHRLRDRD